MAILDYAEGSGPLCDRAAKKKWIIGGVVTIIVIIIIIIIVVTTTGGSEDKPGSSVLNDVPLIDGSHNLAHLLRTCAQNNITELPISKDLRASKRWGKNSTCRTQWDIPRSRYGQLHGQIWVASAPCSSQFHDATAIVLEQIDVLKRMMKREFAHMTLVTDPDEFNDAFESNKVGGLISVSGGHAIDSRIALLRVFQQMGVRAMAIAACSTPWLNNTTPTKTPLSPFGKSVVGEMNRLGMLIDLTGASNDVITEVLNVTRAPVMVTHTAFADIYDVPGNLDTDMLKEIKSNQGIVMVSFDAKILSDKSNLNMSKLVEHLDKIVAIVGRDCIGLGAGFGGLVDTIAGMDDVSSYPQLFDYLLDKENGLRWDHDDLKMLASGNILRVLNMVLRVSSAGNLMMEPNQKWISMEELINANPNITECRSEEESILSGE